MPVNRTSWLSERFNPSTGTRTRQQGEGWPSPREQARVVVRDVPKGGHPALTALGGCLPTPVWYEISENRGVHFAAKYN